MAPLVKLEVDFDPLVAGVGLVKTQLPFAIARTLTLCAQDGQSAGRQVERSVFKLRNDWTVSNTRIVPATKQTLAAEVYTDTSNRITGAPDYIPRQQDGGEKVPFGGHKHIAIPTRYLWKYTPATRPIPDKFRPKALLPPNAVEGQVYSGQFAAGRAAGVKRAISKTSIRKLGSNEYAAFFQRTKSGTLCIFVRHAGVRSWKGVGDAEPWYVLVPSAHLNPILPFEQVVVQVAEANVGRNWDRAVLETAINDVLRGTGVSFKT